MDYLKYLRNNKYEKGLNDCWTLVQDIYKDEHNISLPDCPIFESPDEWAEYLKVKSNVPYRIVNKPFKGCLIHFKYKDIEHIGYALNESDYIHKTFTSVAISKIPTKCIIYEVLND